MLFVYEDGVYRPHGERLVRRLAKEYAKANLKPAAWSSRLADETIAYLLADAPDLDERPPVGVINVRNGLFDLTTGKLREHDPALRTMIQLPVMYDPSAVCSMWEYLSLTSFAEDACHLAFEIPAWCACPSFEGELAVLLYGEGRNGKSQYLGGLCAFLGADNVSHVSLQKLDEDRFSSSMLHGKLANIDSDLPNAKLRDTAVFKALTGGDPIMGERKFKAPFFFRPFAKPIFACNQPLQSNDASYAFQRRWLVVRFGSAFEGNARLDPTWLRAELTQDSELSGVLNRVIEVAPKMRTAGFTIPESCELAKKEFLEVADPVRAWLQRFVEEVPGSAVPKADLYAAFAADCERNRRTMPTKNALGRALSRIMPALREGQRLVDGRRADVYLGLRFRRAV